MGCEGCDDGNTSDDDARLTTRVPARCGDGVVRRDRGRAKKPLRLAMTATMDDDACLNTAWSRAVMGWFGDRSWTSQGYEGR